MKCTACQTENPAAATTCAQCHATLVSPTAVVVTIDLSPGSLFHGRYEILGMLGRGGMGMVYRARDRTLDELVAIKVLRPDFGADSKMTERFKSEIKLARRIRHRNVCSIHDFGDEQGLLFISMELIEGSDLKYLLRKQGAFPADRAYDVALQLADGLEAVHAAGIIHRDLKTPNVILDSHGIVHLMDFGIAKRHGAVTAVTSTGQIVGTPEYMSPEQAQGRPIDFRSDIYALGILTYELFTGDVPFRGDTPISTILKHLHEPPPLDGVQAERLPDGVKQVIRRALAKAPEDRYATVRDFSEALLQARSPSRRQQPLATLALEAPTLPDTALDSGGSRRTWWVAGGLVVAALLVGGVALFWLTGRNSAPQPAVATAATTTTTQATQPPPPETTLTRPALLPVQSPSPLPTPTPTAPPRTLAARALPTPTPPPPTTLPLLVMLPPPSAPVTTVAAGTGMLQIAVRPWGEVFVDGTLIGTTPLDRIALPSGSHSVRIRHPTYVTIERQVVVAPGQTAKLVVDLPAEGTRKP